MKAVRRANHVITPDQEGVSSCCINVSRGRVIWLVVLFIMRRAISKGREPSRV